jgi:hypothetical protein
MAVELELLGAKENTFNYLYVLYGNFNDSLTIQVIKQEVYNSLHWNSAMLG